MLFYSPPFFFFFIQVSAVHESTGAFTPIFGNGDNPKFLDGPGSPEIRRVWCVPCGLLDRQAPRRSTPISHDPALVLHFTTGRRLFFDLSDLSRERTTKTWFPYTNYSFPRQSGEVLFFSPGIIAIMRLFRYQDRPAAEEKTVRDHFSRRFWQRSPSLLPSEQAAEAISTQYAIAPNPAFSGQPFVCRAYPARKSASSIPDGPVTKVLYCFDLPESVFQQAPNGKRSTKANNMRGGGQFLLPHFLCSSYAPSGRFPSRCHGVKFDSSRSNALWSGGQRNLFHSLARDAFY